MNKMHMMPNKVKNKSKYTSEDSFYSPLAQLPPLVYLPNTSYFWYLSYMYISKKNIFGTLKEKKRQDINVELK